jgi:hypothetical protein
MWSKCKLPCRSVPLVIVIHLLLSTTSLSASTVHMLIMHIVIMHKSHNASTFEDPDVVPN